MGPDREQMIARKTRMVSIVIVATMIFWIGAQYLGRKFGVAGNYAFLFDLIALAGFFWSMVVIYQIWRARREQ